MWCIQILDFGKSGSTDSEMFLVGKGFQLMNDVWASPIEVAIALWLLQRELGIASIVPAIMAVSTYPSTTLTIWT